MAEGTAALRVPGTASPGFAVAGSPIAHSLSPLLHTAAARELGLTGFVYERIEAEEAGLAGLLDSRPDLRGISLTMPLKRRLVEIAAEHGWHADAAVLETGAANTLLRDESLPGGGEILNTDVGGIVAAVAEAQERALTTGAGLPAAEGTADVLGAGATAGSALAAASRLGVSHALLFVRNRNRAGEARAVAEAVGITTELHDLADWVPGERGLTFSTLPAGVLGGQVPVPGRVEALFFDAAYAVQARAWHRRLRDRGALVVDGTRMLLHQAVAQHMRFAQLAGVPAAAARAARPRILAAMDAALAGR